ncbi:DNA polymerase gamma [Aulographum hederae CBS 113979]|uniref:DNA-directed DNA polymerase n=1 Tax=Aulographum hederae CBS 113979 TaxID=1176131 RepID=A0A6G1GLC5_9PEZI|nr:DNA polymerase gamma [Aulographum hederae CBS 113979]
MQSFRQRRLLAQLPGRHRALLHASLPPPSWYYFQRCYADSAAPHDDAVHLGLSVPSEARFNEIGVQQLSSHVHPQIFPGQASKPPPELIELSKDHLRRHDLYGKNQDSTPPVGFDLPTLQGTTLDEHFHKLGMESAEPYLSDAKRYARANAPPRPRKWVKRSGWTKYNSDGSSEAVEYPDEAMLTFDTEVMWKETKFACMACAVSPTHWYAWISPWLLEESESDRHLIPLGPPEKARIIIGHNIGYDRARIAEEYNVEQSNNFFLDTMSLHVAVNGMCSRQRPTWQKHKKAREVRDKIAASEEDVELNAMLIDEEEELWVGRSSVNSLRDVAKFHCGITIDKAQREYFGELDRAGVRGKFDELLDYCAADVDITHKVYKRVFPNFLETCPHPVSFAALRHLSSEILPVNKEWETYLANAEATYRKLSDAVQQRLFDLAERALALKDKPEEYEKDPWLSQLDWSGQEIRMAKGKKKDDPPRPVAKQKKPGMPNWYKDLFATSTAPINLTVRTRISPLLLRLSWDGFPIVWSDVHGFVYAVPRDEALVYVSRGLNPCDMSSEENLTLKDNRKELYFKLPHKDGPQARCATPLAKGYLAYFEQGKLSSEFTYAKEALEMNASCSYWISARDRIMGQMVVYNEKPTTVKTPAAPAPKKRGRPRKNPTPVVSRDPPAQEGFILPQIIPMGTITRRSVENTWLTASNAKPNRVGSELKSMITAPPGYVFVGADVDSQELWIASLVGDAQFQIHGGNAIGFMTLEGTKAAGTDLHSRTAKILGISRNDAKVFNYGRIYGAGQRFATMLLRQFNGSLSDNEASKTSVNLYTETKGKKTTRKVLRDRPFWRGGTESFVFNRLEDFAEEDRPRTPVLGAGITEALMRRYLSKGGFLTSRVNWAIQSSGVDYLHLLIVGMEYLTKRYNLGARLAITVHDEIRYLVKEEDKYKAAMALQVANVWTRAMFAQQMGVPDLPQSCAYFSAVDIDKVLRKEVDMDVVTPSHTTPIPHGESIDIVQLLAKGDFAKLDPNVTPNVELDVQRWDYEARTPVMETFRRESDLSYLKAQITASDEELKEIIRERRLGATDAAFDSSPAFSRRTTTSSVKAARKPRASPSSPTTAKPRPKSKPKPKSQSALAKDAFKWGERREFRHETRIPELMPVDEWNGTQFFKAWEGAKKLNGWANFDSPVSSGGGGAGFGV